VGPRGQQHPSPRRGAPRGDVHRRRHRRTSLLVGADCAWSRVRPLLSSAIPEYVGKSVVETYLFDADTRHPAAAKAVGGGSKIASMPGREIFAHRERDDALHAYVILSEPQDWFAAIDFTDPAMATARIAQEFDGWAPELTALITDGDIAPVPRPLYALPTGHRWDRVPMSRRPTSPR
jgi:2-polyprenyl-6-methoxyphenol hydroxylase-like FAD-dependent oxidoreductase